MPNGDNNMQNSAELPPIEPLPGFGEQPSSAKVTEEANEATPNYLPDPDEREPYGFCKRFLRGYPRLVLWFPESSRPATKARTLTEWRRARRRQRPPARANEAAVAGYESPDAPRRTPAEPLGFAAVSDVRNIKVIP